VDVLQTDEWLAVAAIAVAVVAIVVGAIVALRARRPTPQSARADARKLSVGFDLVPTGAQGSPGFHPTLLGQVRNDSTTDRFQIVKMLADLGRDGDHLTEWWQAAEGLDPGECRRFRLPESWPCTIDVYYEDHLERLWRRRVHGISSVFGDAERVRRRQWPRMKVTKRHWWSIRS
jgi:hypothetical protein